MIVKNSKGHKRINTMLLPFFNLDSCSKPLKNKKMQIIILAEKNIFVEKEIDSEMQVLKVTIPVPPRINEANVAGNAMSE